MQVKKLKASIQKLKAENEGYRKDNKAAEFEAQLQVMLLSLLIPLTCPASAQSCFSKDCKRLLLVSSACTLSCCIRIKATSSNVCSQCSWEEAWIALTYMPSCIILLCELSLACFAGFICAAPPSQLAQVCILVRQEALHKLS